jgi:hypothetical protein
MSSKPFNSFWKYSTLLKNKNVLIQAILKLFFLIFKNLYIYNKNYLMETNQTHHDEVETNQSELKPTPPKINGLVAIGIVLNIIAWLMGTSNSAILGRDHSKIWVGVSMCVIGGFLCIAGKNVKLAILCFIDAYLLYDLLQGLNHINSIY